MSAGIDKTRLAARAFLYIAAYDGDGCQRVCWNTHCHFPYYGLSAVLPEIVGDACCYDLNDHRQAATPPGSLAMHAASRGLVTAPWKECVIVLPPGFVAFAVAGEA